MNRHLLLIVASPFGMGWRGGTARLMYFGSGLAQHGWEATLISAERDERLANVIEGPEKAFPGRVVRTPFGATPEWLRRRFLWRAERSWSDNLCALGLGWPRRLHGWYRQAPDLPKPDVVLGVSTGGLVDIIAAQRIARLADCPLVVEFRDPCPPRGARTTLMERRALGDCLTAASVVLTTTQALADQLSTRFAGCRGKTSAIHHFYDDTIPLPKDTTATAGKELNLLFVGTLYPTLAPGAFALLGGLAEFLKQRPEARAHTRLRFLGGSGGSGVAESIAAEVGISDVLESLAEQPPAAAIRTMDSADVLVVVNYANEWALSCVPGKVPQYMSRGKPILGVTPPCEAADIIRQSGLGVVAPPNDPEAVARILSHYWEHRSELGELFRPNWDYINQFSHTAAMARIHGLLEEAVASYSGATGGDSRGAATTGQTETP